jgi:hypothetical protein
MCGGVLSAGESSFASMGVVLTNATTLRNTTLSGNSTSRLRLNPRAAPSNILLTIYGNIDGNDLPPGAPGMGAGTGTGSKDTGTGQGEVPVVTVTSPVTITYTTICPTDAARLITLEYCTTVTTTQPCNGSTTVAPAVPMKTYVETCDACGPHREDTVTLTVPRAVAAGTGGGQIVAIAVQTVVPILAKPLNTSLANESSTGAGVIPVVAGAGRTAGLGFIATLGYGLALWFVVFSVGNVL